MTGVERISVAALSEWTARLLAAVGLPAPDAGIAAAVLVDADRRGLSTHGVARLAAYADRLAAGDMVARPAIQVEERGGVLVIDAGGGLGQLVASRAVDEARARLPGRAFQAFLLRNAGHLGALGAYVRRAAEQGLVAFIAQVSQPIMAPEGALGAAIGNNPLAFATPLPDGPPLVFDMSCSKVARGNVLLAARTGQAIPGDWAIGRDGTPTTDPAEALLGAMLPLGGYKGLGLAMLVQVLAGSLTGAVPRTLPGQGAAADVGAFGFVLDPDELAGRAAFDAHLRQWIGHYRAKVGENGRLPGERAERQAAESDRFGIALSPAIRNELTALGARLSVPFPLVTPVDPT